MKSEKQAVLENILNDNGVLFSIIDHPEVFTVETMLPYVKHLDAAICKNLFLKDKKKNHYLLSCVHDSEVKLNDVAKAVNAPGGLRLADESVLEAMLGVKQGCVTALSLHVDKDTQVKFICDKRLIDGTYKSVSFHPMVNSATLTLSAEDFLRYLQISKHEPMLLNFSSS